MVVNQSYSHSVVVGLKEQGSVAKMLLVYNVVGITLGKFYPGTNPTIGSRHGGMGVPAYIYVEY